MAIFIRRYVAATIDSEGGIAVLHASKREVAEQKFRDFQHNNGPRNAYLIDCHLYQSHKDETGMPVLDWRCDELHPKPINAQWLDVEEKVQAVMDMWMVNIMALADMRVRTNFGAQYSAPGDIDINPSHHQEARVCTE